MRDARMWTLLTAAPALLLAGCAGEDRGPEVAALRAKTEAQASEIDGLRKTVKDLDARSRALEERLAAAPADAKAAPAAAAPAKAASKDAPAPADAAAPADSP